MSESGKRIDWDEVRSRLHQSQEALERALNTDAEDLAAIYRERAVQLAHRRERDEDSSSKLCVLVFLLGAERYALELADLTELRPFVNCTPVPTGPPELLGVLNVHGEIRSVVDLGRLLALPNRESTEGGYVLLVRKQERETGLRVDSVDAIQLLAVDQLSIPDGEEATAIRYLKGLTPDRLRVLNAEAILAHPIYNTTMTDQR